MDGGFPFAVVGVQNKAAFRMNRSAGKNRLPGNRLILTAQPQLLKNILEHVSGHPVNGDPERALVVVLAQQGDPAHEIRDRKSTRLNSSHVAISYAVFNWK